MNELLIYILAVCDQSGNGISSSSCKYKYERCVESADSAFCLDQLGKYALMKVSYCIDTETGGEADENQTEEDHRSGN